jgi:hypothetical protein
MATKSNYTCQYCNRSFAKEGTLAVHLCEQKRRYQERTERGVDLGLRSYLRFYETSQGSAKNKTWDDFATSPYYRAFVKFGRYCAATRVVNPARYTDWLLKHNKKIDNWASDKLYGEYLLDYTRIEAVADALQRAVEYSIDWGEKNQAQPQDCLRYGGRNSLCHAILSGRISAWVIYNSDSGQKFLQDLNSEQLAMIWPWVETDYWQKRFLDYPADQEFAQDVLKKAGW